MSERMWISEELEKARTERDALRAELEKARGDYALRSELYEKAREDGFRAAMECDSARAERDRQYEENVSQIVRYAALEAERDEVRTDLHDELADVRDELEKARGERDAASQLWRTIAATDSAQVRTLTAERDSAREDYRALKYSYDTLIDCAARHRTERDSARALLRDVAQKLEAVQGWLERRDYSSSDFYGLRARITEEIGQ